MTVWRGGKYQVVQHHLLDIWYLQKWGIGDNPRSYGQHYDFFTISTHTTLKDINKAVSELDIEG